ncbi:hypothetical protein LSCM1_07917 [Leishmania martiniquensis]|uniref:Uncharacterized protein n=1 Tax=Leishmania martiniquensis TaxID=1580590 RepID=A0A836KTH1_9TRYP|nr:hypothetical protein LSCM1_07917 [Leishmania martiniquensis]
MGAEVPCLITCSWADNDSLQGHVHYTFMKEGGMEEAEVEVRESLASPHDSSLDFPANSVAPWLRLQVGDAGVVALCFVTNARVLEIHDAGAEASAPLLTHEAQLSNPAKGLHAHFLCHGGGGVLFPARRAYLLKLFARTPKTSVFVASVHVVLFSRSPSSSFEPHVEGPLEGCGSPEVTQSQRPASETPTAVTMEVSSALQRQLLMLESRIRGALDDVAQRLTHLEGRVRRLETTSDGAHRAGAVDSATQTFSASVPAKRI